MTIAASGRAVDDGKAEVIARLRQEVCDANIELFERGLARFTFGNASAIDRAHRLVVIKPSGSVS